MTISPYAPWIALAVLAVVVVVVVLLFRAEGRFQAKRETNVAAWAKSNGFKYEPLVAGLAIRADDQPFTGSPAAQSRDVITGQTFAGRGFCSFVYEDVVSNGKMSVPVRAWMVSIRLPRRMPLLTVTDKTAAGVLAARLGRDVEVGQDDFDEAFRVESPEPAFARALLTPQVVAWLLGPGEAAVPFRIVAHDMFWWESGDPDYNQLSDRLDLLDGLYDQIPCAVWGSFGRDDAG